MKIAKRLILNIVLILVLVSGLVYAGYKYFPVIFGDALYPLKYEEYIVKYSKQFDVDPAVIAGLIFVESRYNAEAVSRVGARGLMQIMPATAEGIAKRLGEPSAGDLFDPDVNIRYGSYYIKSLIDKYNGDVDAALAWYNGGSVADRYVITRSDASLPAETAAFIKKNNFARSTYSSLYGNILRAENVSELMRIKQEEQKLTWFQKLLTRLGW